MSSEADTDAAWQRVQADPRDHAAWHFLALRCIGAGQVDLGVDYAERAHKLSRKNGEYLATLGVALAEAGRLDDAISTLQRAVKLQPASANARCNLGNALRKARRYPEARESYARAIAIAPGRTDAKGQLALTLLRLGENAEALRLLREVLGQEPENADAIVDVADALSAVEGPEAAVTFLRRQLLQLPEEARVHFRLAQSLLLLGQWQDGWRAYRWRPSARLHEGQRAPEPLPRQLNSKTVLLQPDQGLGDMLFFLRFAGEIPQRGGRACVHAPPKLAGLLRGQEGLPELAGAADIRADFSLRIGDLPFAVQANDVRSAIRLKPRADLVERWREALLALGPAPYVGLTWRAGTDPRNTPEFGAGPAEVLFKDADPALLAPVLKRLNATLISLQRVPRPGETEQLAALVGRSVHDLSAVNEDIEEITAVLSLLDDYVGVSNTNMHLRSALGLGGRVLVPSPPEWRWMAEGATSPWFPAFRVYRQSGRDWSAALSCLSADLDADA